MKEANYKLEIAYEGTHYHGWQIQPNGISIQEEIQKVLAILCKHPVKLIGSGRTDAGVHALGQTAHFKTAHLQNQETFLKSLNALLPSDIRIKTVFPVHFDFHARYSAVSKTYRYHLYLDKVMDPFRRLYCWHVHAKLDLTKIQEAIPFFLGSHDFTSFANEAHLGTASHDPIRTLSELLLQKEPGGYYLEFKADGFLYKMVRNIVGTLVEIAEGKRTLDSIPQLFAEKDRRFAGLAAPPHGLFLVKVEYPNDLILQKSENAEPLSP